MSHFAVEISTLTMFPFHSCSTIGVFGCTSSGKSTLVLKLIETKCDMFETSPEIILYCYNIFQPIFAEREDKVSGLNFHHGLPSSEMLENISKNLKHNLIVLDDLSQKICDNPEMEDLFTQKAHHLRFTVIMINQNIFTRGKFMRTIALNLHYFIFMRNPRGEGQVATLGRQIGEARSLVDAFKDATKCNFGYLVLDLSPYSDQVYKYRTHIFPNEDTVVYIPMKK